MINYLLGIIAFLTVYHLYNRYNRRGRLIEKFPGYYAYPVVGNLLKYTNKSLQELWVMGREMHATYYPISRLWLLHYPVVNVRHPDDAEVLLTSPAAIDKGCIYEYFHPWLKTGLLTSTGDKWRQRRRILTPAFHLNVLKRYLEIMNEEGIKYVSKLKQDDQEPVKSLIPICTRLALNVVTEAAMGVKLDKMDVETIGKYEKAIDDFGKIFIYRMLRPYVFDWMMKIPAWSMGKLQKNTLEVLHNFTNTVIKERRDYHKSTQNKYLQILDESSEVGVNAAHKKRLAMLDLLLSSEQDGAMNHEGVKEEVDTFTLEGTDTTTLALTYTLILLAENKEIQERARKEATTLLNRTKGKIEMDDLHELDYVERCIKEALRLFPPVGTIFRSIKEDLKLKHGVVPGGTQIMFHIFDMHRDPNFWPEPTKYDPDRFLPENCLKRHPFAYVPFSGGHRNCIGYKFALMELRVVLARILYDFELVSVMPSADIKLIADIVLRPAHPVSVKFVKLQKSN